MGEEKKQHDEHWIKQFNTVNMQEIRKQSDDDGDANAQKKPKHRMKW